ncbi:MAG: TlpA disulfide reductase family protein [Duganella sp.]
MNKKHLAAYAGVAVLFAASGAYVGMKKQDAAPITATAPAGVTGPVQTLLGQTLPNAAGVPTALAQYQGKAMLVNFWATWCAPCVQEMPELSELSSGEEGKKLQVIGIGIDSPSNIAAFSDKYKITYPVLVAGMSGTELSKQFGNVNGGLPFTVLIGADGQVKKTYLGRLKFDELRKDLATL